MVFNNRWNFTFHPFLSLFSQQVSLVVTLPLEINFRFSHFSTSRWFHAGMALESRFLCWCQGNRLWIWLHSPPTFSVSGVLRLNFRSGKAISVMTKKSVTSYLSIYYINGYGYSHILSLWLPHLCLQNEYFLFIICSGNFHHSQRYSRVSKRHNTVHFKHKQIEIDDIHF